MPKTQSALLEAMAERQVTVDGATRALPDPFLVLATENPIDYEGTFPLPEAQLDRFFLRTALGYPDADEELQILHEQRTAIRSASCSRSSTIDEIAGAAARRRRTSTSTPVLQRWIVDLVRATRERRGRLGSAPRCAAALALERVAPRLGAPRRPLATSCPRTSSGCSSPVLVHRVVFTPALLAALA